VAFSGNAFFALTAGGFTGVAFFLGATFLTGAFFAAFLAGTFFVASLAALTAAKRLFCAAAMRFLASALMLRFLAGAAAFFSGLAVAAFTATLVATVTVEKPKPLIGSPENQTRFATQRFVARPMVRS